jgi:hypothetical protein
MGLNGRLQGKANSADISIPRIKSKVFTIKVDAKFDELLHELQTYFQKDSRAEIFRMGAVALKLIKEAHERGEKLSFVDSESDQAKKEVLWPGLYPV